MLTGRAASRCAVWGRPVEHSLSPVLHRAAYDALGLDDWSYDRREVDEAGFADALAGLDGTWRGLSLTMPLKVAALAAAAHASSTARAAGGANTLVRVESGWSAHNTDVEGIQAALGEHGVTHVDHAVVVGSGATARSAVLALAAAGLGRVTFMVRAAVRPETVDLTEALGLEVDAVEIGDWPTDADVIVSTVPPAGLAAAAPPPVVQRRLQRPRVLLDVVYGAGTTPVQLAAAERGWTLVPGTDMLLHQAAAQVRLMTGREAPLGAMRDALHEALARRGSSPAPPPRA
ncbi:shikimate dehydrogenase [Intrasporangium mesophilum]